MSTLKDTINKSKEELQSERRIAEEVKYQGDLFQFINEHGEFVVPRMTNFADAGFEARRLGNLQLNNAIDGDSCIDDVIMVAAAFGEQCALQNIARAIGDGITGNDVSDALSDLGIYDAKDACSIPDPVGIERFIEAIKYSMRDRIEREKQAAT